MTASLLERAARRLGAARLHASLSPEQLEVLPYVWAIRGRPEQLTPGGDWRWWLVSAGRGWGKTKTGSEFATARARALPGSVGFLVGQTPTQVRKVMVEGPAGILSSSPPWFRPRWFPSKHVLVWPNGARAEVYSGAAPEGLRGPQCHWAWVDELAKMPRSKEVFDQLNFGMRLGKHPRAIITTTPRPVEILKDLARGRKHRVHLTRGTTYENRPNLAESFLHEVLGRYEGTRLGRQELGGELLADMPGALWTSDMLDAPGFRVEQQPDDAELIVVAIDPSASDEEGSNETGIIGMGARWTEERGRLVQRQHVYRDATVSEGGPGDRVRAALNLFVELQADRIVVETNNGGDWIPAVIASEWTAMELPGAAPVECVTATRGKRTRAEPIAALYEQRKVTHAPGLGVLEEQLRTWSPLLLGASPDRMDALVWASTWLSQQKPRILV